MELPEIPQMNETQRNLFETSVFLGKLLAFGLVFRSILYIYPDTTALQVILAGSTTQALNFFGMAASHQDLFILLDGSAFRITQDCLGWKSLTAFLALTLSTPKKPKTRVIILGAAFLIAANFARILTTVYLTHTGLVSFEVVHNLLWKWGLTALVFLTWAFWYTGGAGNLSEHLNKRTRKL